MKKRRSMNEFCRDIIRLLTDQGMEFLVGGYDTLRHHTGIDRETKDFDLMVRPSDVASVLDLCRNAGYGAELAFLSRNQFIADIEVDRFLDARSEGRSAMTTEQIKEWTVAGVTEQLSRKVQGTEFPQLRP